MKITHIVCLKISKVLYSCSFISYHFLHIVVAASWHLKVAYIHRDAVF